MAEKGWFAWLGCCSPLEVRAPRNKKQTPCSGHNQYHFCLYIFPQDEVVDVQLELGDESGPKDYFHGEYK